MRNSCLYKLGGTKTFRRSSVQILSKKQVVRGKTVSKGWGSNMQNWEKYLRQIYQPDGFSKALTEKCQHWLETGDITIFTQQELDILRVFIQSDQSGAEALIVAYECTAAQYRQLFINGVKPHVYVALKLFKDIWKKRVEQRLIDAGLDIDVLCDTPITELKRNPFWRDVDTLIKSSDNWPAQERYYYLAKQTCHSSNYGIEGNTFRTNVLDKSAGKINLDITQAKAFLDTYRTLFPEIPERNDRIAYQAQHYKILYNLFGHPYQITDYYIESRLKELYAWSAQSTVGEITRIASTNLYDYIEANNKSWDILADTHDSYLLQCPLYDVKEATNKMREFMNIPLVSPVDSVKFNMKSEQNIGFNWNSQKKEVNPLGLQEVSWL